MSNATRVSLRLTGLALFLIIWELAGRYLGDALMAPPSAVASERCFLCDTEVMRDGRILPRSEINRDSSLTSL